MKKFFLLLFVICSFQNKAQVNCDLTYTRTLSGFDVFIHNPSGATMYRAKMYIDADGSPRAYGPNNSGLDWTANAGYPGNWWALVTDANGDPILQGPSDPYPGMYVCATSLVNSQYGINNPLRYVNSETVPYIAMPTNVLADGGIQKGDVAYVYNTITGQSCFAVYADAGNTTSIGEGSIYLASQIGVDPDARTGGTSLGIIDYVVFPNSGFGQGYIPTIAEIDSIGNYYLNRAVVGGPCIVSCIGPVLDQTAPTTSVTVPALWDTTNFTANYIDADNGGCSGLVQQSFYQVADLNNNDWRSNAARGFLNEDFMAPTLNTDWTGITGTWNLNASNYLEQSDEASTNTNIYAPLTQDLSDEYLYSWTGSLSGSGTNRRAGLHFFVDQPTLSDRGNSYFVYYRLDNDKVQIYEVVNNSWGSSFVAEGDYDFNSNTNYDFKIRYNRITGVINVYVNNVKVLSWTDTTPLTTGAYISFRSGNCIYKVDDFKVYRSRTASTNVLVGAGNTNDMRYQNPNPATPAGRINSIVADANGNLSTNASEYADIDFTPPTGIAAVNDGISTDIDTTYNGTQLKANWSTSTDPHSGIINYYYAIGTSPGTSDVVPWTSNGTSTSVSEAGLTLVHMQTYYVSVMSENAALMNSSVITSDGQVYINSAVGLKGNEDLDNQLTVYPNPGNGMLTIQTDVFGNNTQISVLDITGKSVYNSELKSMKTTMDLSAIEEGIYFVIITGNSSTLHSKIQIRK